MANPNHDQSRLGNRSRPLDVAIVGAGPGGLYTAWRLAEAPVDTYTNIAIFEATDRLGGRVRTLPRELVPFTCDIGAMRFLKHQLLISSLIARFFLPHTVFLHDVPVASYFLRGHHLVPPAAPAQDARPRKGRRGRAAKRPVLCEHLSADKKQPQTLFRTRTQVCKTSPSHILVYGLAQALSKVNIDKSSDDVNEFDADRIERILRELGEADPTRLVEALKPLRPSDWRMVQNHGKIDGRHLYMYSLWELLQSELPREDSALGQEALGYHTIFGAWNAAEHIPWFLSEFGDVKYNAIRGGMSQLIEKLGTQILLRINNRLTRLKMANRTAESVIQRNLLLTRVRCHRTGSKPLYELIFERTNDATFRRDGEPGKSISVFAHRVVLSLSKGALERIAFDSSMLLNRNLAREVGVDRRMPGGLPLALRACSANSLMKAFLLYQKPWFWDGLHPKHQPDMADSGRATLDGQNFVCSKVLTDTPIRQLYFHGPRGPWWRNGVPEDGDSAQADGGYSIRGMIMAYCDATESDYWSLLSKTHGVGKPQSAFASDAYQRLCQKNKRLLEKTLEDIGVSGQFQKVFHNHVSAVFGPDTLVGGEKAIPGPEAIYFMDWRRAPYYGGWHAWNITYRPWAIRAHIWRPFAGEQVFLCGEAISADQGWIEGALRTAERVLIAKDGFGLPAPDWEELRASVKSDGGQWMPPMARGKESSKEEAKRISKAIESYIAW